MLLTAAAVWEDTHSVGKFSGNTVEHFGSFDARDKVSNC
jgi:hypothetical protein